MWTDGQNRAPPRTRHRVPCPGRRDAEGVVLAPVQPLSAVAGTRCVWLPRPVLLPLRSEGGPGPDGSRCCGLRLCVRVQERRGGWAGPRCPCHQDGASFPEAPRGYLRPSPWSGLHGNSREPEELRPRGCGAQDRPGQDRPACAGRRRVNNCPPRPGRRVLTTVPGRCPWCRAVRCEHLSLGCSEGRDLTALLCSAPCPLAAGTVPGA